MLSLADDLKKKLLGSGFGTIDEVRDYLGLSRSMIYNLLEAGDLTYARFGRARRIPWSSVRDYAEKHLVVR
jgi:excisionase family DNA binding protein